MNTSDILKYKKDIDNTSINLLLGAGYQKKFFYEIGIGHGRFQGVRGNVANYGYYGAYERTLATNSFKPVNGIKTGVYFASLSGGLGTEIKYQWYNKKYDWVIIPKFGVGLGGMMQLNYGYNISLRNQPFEQIGLHQFGMIINLPIKIQNNTQD